MKIEVETMRLSDIPLGETVWRLDPPEWLHSNLVRYFLPRVASGCIEHPAKVPVVEPTPDSFQCLFGYAERLANTTILHLNYAVSKLYGWGAVPTVAADQIIVRLLPAAVIAAEDDAHSEHSLKLGPEAPRPMAPASQEMTTKGHAPGPWTRLATVADKKTVVLVGRAGPADGRGAISDEQTIAIVPLVNDESEASLRLILAAPDLLKALRTIADEPQWSATKTLDEVERIAKTAILKAEGRDHA